ncbi:F0F1 ATP synthase subunit delta [Candidatus Roizmanbacteria bacterium]|jgi:F0F1-type ATP synthase delta subunit|nr:F0F1 ATP synthase subunit delta [Candidatus Roizmanbacteria bacterium]
MESKPKTIIVSPYKLEQADLESLGRNFEFIDLQKVENVVDESLIAGVVIKNRSKVIDLSFRGKLFNLKRYLYETD